MSKPCTADIRDSAQNVFKVSQEQRIQPPWCQGGAKACWHPLAQPCCRMASTRQGAYIPRIRLFLPNPMMGKQGATAQTPKQGFGSAF